MSERRLNFRYLLTPDGLQRDRAVVVDEAGMIRSIEAAKGNWDGTLALPGMPNAHSHVFQRALSGLGEARHGEDSFWSWREAMYRLAARVDAEAMYAIARFAYGEMLAAGFTSVAEFHYLHHAPDGAPGPEMAEAVVEAARDAGIRLRLLPVLYQRGGFGRPAGPGQARFLHEQLEDFLGLLETLKPIRPGLAFHSLRAVAVQDVAPSLSAVRDILGGGIPVHIHIAEQAREVEDCLAASGRRPVELLLDSVALDAHWSLVHATHAGREELEAVRAAGARVVVCPLTEAYLGDGLFPGRDYLAPGGEIAIGSDANARIDAVEELRWLEYGQRLRDRARARFSDARGLGEALWRRVATGGAAALGLPVGRIEPGAAADFVVLEGEADVLIGLSPGRWLEALVVGGSRADIAAVVVGGEPRVEKGNWAGKSESAARYHACVKELVGKA
ncbi:MAG: formimidoylglutamate deiminase [Gammaproteobacteria bacterium]|nr:formimidoylglutamate deiminase [Gammaproteobacteria bacterium]